MEQQTANPWPNGGFELNQEELELMSSHMTPIPTHLATEFPNMDDDLLGGIHPSLRYIPNLDVSDFEFASRSFAEPNVVAHGGEDIDISLASEHQHNMYEPIKDGYQVTPHYKPTASQFPHQFQKQYDAAMHSAGNFESPLGAQGYGQNYIQPGLYVSAFPINNLSSSQVSFSSQQPEPMGKDFNISQNRQSTPAVETPKASKMIKYRRRKEKARFRQSMSRTTSSPPSSSPQKRAIHRETSNSSDTADSQSTDAQQEFEMFQPTSTLAQRKKAYLMQQMKAVEDQKADLVRQMKELMVDDERFGGASDNDSNVNIASTASSSKISVSNSEILDSDDTADNTSISSTPRQPPENISTLMEIDLPQRKHDPCADCGFKPLYCCTYPGCSHATHSSADCKRHEAGECHWPQNRFMCLECTLDPDNPEHKVPTNENGQPMCEFCSNLFSSLSSTPKEHFLQCKAARNNGTTFGRADHLIEHLRKIHDMKGANKTEQKEINKTVATWKYPIDSKWPRQCGFCGALFKTWDERMRHLAEHFQAGLTMKEWKLPFLPPKDFRPGPDLPSRKDDDDDDGGDNDDSPHGGNGGSRSNCFGHQRGSQKHTAQSGSSQNNTSRSSRGQGTHGRQQNQTMATQLMKRRHVGEKDILSQDDVFVLPFITGERRSRIARNVKNQPLTLERYLNDPCEPIMSRLDLRLKSEFGSASRVEDITTWQRKDPPTCPLEQRQPERQRQETQLISQGESGAEVKGIYAGLVMREAKCIEVGNKQSTIDSVSQPKLNNEPWQALVTLHRTSLHEHHDFIPASQHPSASQARRQLASNNAMSARLSRNDIHSSLELPRHRRPAALDHMLAYNYLADSIMGLLQEAVSAFEDTWKECLQLQTPLSKRSVSMVLLTRSVRKKEPDHKNDKSFEAIKKPLAIHLRLGLPIETIYDWKDSGFQGLDFFEDSLDVPAKSSEWTEISSRPCLELSLNDLENWIMHEHALSMVSSTIRVVMHSDNLRGSLNHAYFRPLSMRRGKRDLPRKNLIERANQEVVRFLVKAGANLYQDGSLMAAAKLGNLDIISTLLDTGADMNETSVGGAVGMNDVPIEEAERLGNRAIINILLQTGADINRAKSSGYRIYRNALQTACGRGDLDVVRYLLQARAEFNWPTARQSGLTFLQTAVESRNVDLVRSLIDASADLNGPAAEEVGRSALMQALISHASGLMQHLLDAGVLANDAPEGGLNLLQCATRTGDDDLIKLSLDRGADINLVALDNHDILTCAFCGSASPNKDWTKISNLTERRRIQNRAAQRNNRRKLKEPLEDLEKRAGSSFTSPPQKDVEPLKTQDENLCIRKDFTLDDSHALQSRNSNSIDEFTSNIVPNKRHSAKPLHEDDHISQNDGSMYSQRSHKFGRAISMTTSCSAEPRNEEIAFSSGRAPPPINSGKERRLVVAIDYGTTYTGVAFATPASMKG